MSNSSEDAVLSFAGSVTIASIAEAYQQMSAAMDASPVLIDVSEVAEADLTFIQLIESARRSAAESGRDIALTRPADGAVLEILQRGGFLGDEDPDRTNFWLQGAAQ